MKAANVKVIAKALGELDSSQRLEVILSLSKFKKENKEYLSYLLFEKADEDNYIANIKLEMDEMFEGINTSHYYYMKKSIRKIQRSIKTYVRYSKKKTTEVELLIYFCEKMLEIEPSIKSNQVILNIYLRQRELINKAISCLHEDLRFDYQIELDKLDE